jgi:hypothetical protein
MVLGMFFFCFFLSLSLFLMITSEIVIDFLFFGDIPQLAHRLANFSSNDPLIFSVAAEGNASTISVYIGILWPFCGDGN